MSEKLTDMIPKEELKFFGLTLQRMSMDIAPIINNNNQGNTFTLVLIRESGQVFELENLNFYNGVAPLANIRIGELNIIASVVSWEETTIDIGGNSIFTITMSQDTSLYLDSFILTTSDIITGISFKNTNHQTTQGFLNNIEMQSQIIDGKLFGIESSKLFNLFKDKIFLLGNAQIFFDFTNLLKESISDPLIYLGYESPTLFTAIDDYAKNNNFNYCLDFKLINKILVISFIKNKNITLSNPISGKFNNILDAIENADNDKIISYKKGFAIAENFAQKYEISDSSGIITTGSSLSETAIDGGIDTNNPTILGNSLIGGGEQAIQINANLLNKKIINIVYGGLESDFIQFTKNDIRQFWGFDSKGNLISDTDVPIKEMEDILNFKKLFGDNEKLRKFMSLWGRQFIMNSSIRKKILPLTQQQQDAVNKEKQAMVDLIDSLLIYFKSLPIRYTGDDTRDTRNLFSNFLGQYSINHPDITEKAIIDFQVIMIAGTAIIVGNPIDFNGILGLSFLSKTLYVANFDSALNNFNNNGPYPSIDDILIFLGKVGDIYKLQGYVGLSLKSTTISLVPTTVLEIIPSGIEISPYCFPSIDHPLSGYSLAKENFRESQGEWPSYIQLGNLPQDDATNKYEYADKITASINYMTTPPNSGVSSFNHFAKVNVRQYKNFYIIDLYDQLMQVQSTKLPTRHKSVFPFTGSPLGGEDKPTIDLTIPSNIKQAFISTINTRKRYGPFIISDGKLLTNQEYNNLLISPNSIIKNIIDDTMVPENFSNNGNLSKDESLIKMQDFIIKNTGSSNPLQRFVQSFGTLEVAGMPRKEAFDGTIYPDGSFIDRVSISVDIGGIKTIYYVKRVVPPVIKSKQKEAKSLPVTQTIFKPQPILQPSIKEPNQPSSKERGLTDNAAVTFAEQQGGLGVITGFGLFGYIITMLSFQELWNVAFALVGGNVFTDVINLAELEGGQGNIQGGTHVTVTLQHDSPEGPGIPTIDVTPPSSAKGIITESLGHGIYKISLDKSTWNRNEITLDNLEEESSVENSIPVGSKATVNFDKGNFTISVTPQTFAPPKP